jgi:hypothetical protein
MKQMIQMKTETTHTGRICQLNSFDNIFNVGDPILLRHWCRAKEAGNLVMRQRIPNTNKHNNKRKKKKKKKRRCKHSYQFLICRFDQVDGVGLVCLLVHRLWVFEVHHVSRLDFETAKLLELAIFFVFLKHEKGIRISEETKPNQTNKKRKSKKKEKKERKKTPYPLINILCWSSRRGAYRRTGWRGS